MCLVNSVINLVRLALEEDLGVGCKLHGDLTGQLIDENLEASAVVVAKSAGVVSGFLYFEKSFKILDCHVEIEWYCNEGDKVEVGKVVCEVKGNARVLLAAERTALNFLQTLSGTASFARNVKQKFANSKVLLLDTRKTIPGLRFAQKRAVNVSGGHNHRFGLFDMVLIKENHIAAIGSIKEAVYRARKLYPKIKIEVEVRNIDEFVAAQDTAADIIMLDNFRIADIKEVIKLNVSKKLLEVSGGITLDNLDDYLDLKIDYLSMGELTKQVIPLDLSMLIKYEKEI